MSTTPWNGSAVAIVFADQRTVLSLRTAREGDNPAMVFETKGSKAQLEDLYATLAASKLPVKSSGFVLYGKNQGDNGRPKAIVSEHQQAYTDKEGNERKGNYAYSSKQLDEFVPLSFAIVTKWLKINGRSIPTPLFLAHATPYERTREAQEMGFQRVTQAKVADVPPLARAVAKSKA